MNPAFDEEFLAHYGVKGMKWGVIRDKASQSKARAKASFQKIDKKKLKKAAVIGGSILAGAAALAIAGSYASKYQHGSIGKLSVTDIPPATNDVKDFVAKVGREPESVIHSSRARNRGFEFLQKGGLTDAFPEWAKVFDAGGAGAAFQRYGERGEKIAVRFNDPEGRKDAAGRVIPHEVIIPERLASGITTQAQAEKVAWDLVKDDYQKFWDKYEANRY